MKIFRSSPLALLAAFAAILVLQPHAQAAPVAGRMADLPRSTARDQARTKPWFAVRVRVQSIKTQRLIYSNLHLVRLGSSVRVKAGEMNYKVSLVPMPRRHGSPTELGVTSLECSPTSFWTTAVAMVSTTEVPEPGAELIRANRH